MNVTVNSNQAFGEYRDILVCICGFSGAQIRKFVCVDCPSESEMSLIASDNIARLWQINNHFVEKTDCECEALRIVSIQQLVAMVDLVWEVLHYISQNFSDDAVRVVGLLKTYTCDTAFRISDICDSVVSTIFAAWTSTYVTSLLFLYCILFIYCIKCYVFQEKRRSDGHFEAIFFFSKFLKQILNIVYIPNPFTVQDAVHMISLFISTLYCTF